MGAQFGQLAGQALETAQRQFLERADARFRQSEETAGQNLKAMLQPVSDRLHRYEEGVAKVEAERRDAFGNLTGLIESMRIGQEKVSSEAAKLVNSLRNAPKARGRWGEQQLRNVLETCGLAEHTDFQTEVSIAAGDEGGRLRPDAIITRAGRAQSGDRRQGVAQRLSGRLRGGRRGRAPQRLGRACRRDARARQRPRQQGLLEPVRRRARLCHHVRARRAFRLGRAGARSAPLGFRVRKEGVARDTYQSGRDRAHGRGGLAAGKDGQAGATDRRARQGTLRPARQGDGRPARRSARGSTRRSRTTTASSTRWRAARW